MNVIEFSVKAIDDFTAVMNKASQQTTGLEKAFLALGAAGAAYAAVNAVRTSLDNAEALGTAALKANTTVEAYSALAYAASQSNVESGSLATGLKFLSKAMADTADSDAGIALSLLGVSAKDAAGNMRPTIDVLFDVAKAMEKAEGDANKTQIAMAIFGRSGLDMVPMLNQGSEAIKGMMDNAKKLGLVVSDDFAKSADQVNDNLSTLSKVLNGSVNVAMAQISPVIEQLTGRMVSLATEGNAIAQVGDVIASGLRVAISAALVAVGTFKTLGDLLGGVIAAVVQVASGEFTAAFDTLGNTAADVETNIKSALGEVSKVWDESAQAADSAAAKQMSALKNLGAVKEANKKATEDAEKAEKAWAESLKEATALMVSQQSPYDQHIAKVQDLERHRAALTAQGADVEKMIANENAAWEVARTKLEGYKNSVTSVGDEMNRMLEEKFSSMGNATFQMAEMFANVTNQAIKGVGDAIAAVAVDGADMMKMMDNIAKSVLKTVISTLVQIGIQRLILAAIDSTATKSGSMQKMSAAMGEVYLNSFASAAAIPVVGFALAPAVAATNTVIAAAGATASMAAGAGLGAAAHGGLDYVPAEQTYQLAQGERVLSPSQNRDLKDFMSTGGNSGVTIDNLTIHVLENVTTANAYASMSRVQLRNALGQPVVDALNEMFKIGIRPNFAMQGK